MCDSAYQPPTPTHLCGSPCSHLCTCVQLALHEWPQTSGELSFFALPCLWCYVSSLAAHFCFCQGSSWPALYNLPLCNKPGVWRQLSSLLELVRVRKMNRWALSELQELTSHTFVTLCLAAGPERPGSWTFSGYLCQVRSSTHCLQGSLTQISRRWIVDRSGGGAVKEQRMKEQRWCSERTLTWSRAQGAPKGKVSFILTLPWVLPLCVPLCLSLSGSQLFGHCVVSFHFSFFPLPF